MLGFKGFCGSALTRSKGEPHTTGGGAAVLRVGGRSGGRVLRWTGVLGAGGCRGVTVLC